MTVQLRRDAEPPPKKEAGVGVSLNSLISGSREATSVRICEKGGLLYGKRPGPLKLPVLAAPKTIKAEDTQRPTSSRDLETAEDRKARTKRAVEALRIADESSHEGIKMPLDPLPWPRIRDEQLQTVPAGAGSF